MSLVSRQLTHSVLSSETWSVKRIFWVAMAVLALHMTSFLLIMNRPSLEKPLMPLPITISLLPVPVKPTPVPKVQPTVPPSKPEKKVLPQKPKPVAKLKPVVIAKPKPAPSVKVKAVVHEMPALKSVPKLVETPKIAPVAPVAPVASVAPVAPVVAEAPLAVKQQPASNTQATAERKVFNNTSGSKIAKSNAAPPQPSKESHSGGGASSSVVALERVQPTYPSRALSRHIEGKVTLQFTISASGSVESAEVVSADPPDVFDEAALKAIRQWRFKQKIVNGLSVEQRATQTLHFRLSGQ